MNKELYKNKIKTIFEKVKKIDSLYWGIIIFLVIVIFLCLYRNLSLKPSKYSGKFDGNIQTIDDGYYEIEEIDKNRKKIYCFSNTKIIEWKKYNSFVSGEGFKENISILIKYNNEIYIIKTFVMTSDKIAVKGIFEKECESSEIEPFLLNNDNQIIYKYDKEKI